MPLYSERRAVSPHGGIDLAQENRALRAKVSPKKKHSGGPKFNALWSCGVCRYSIWRTHCFLSSSEHFVPRGHATLFRSGLTS